LNIEIINSQKFSEISDFIYSEITTHEDFISKSLKNELTIIQKKDDDKVKLVWYVSDKIIVSDNDIVFCQTELVESFFEIISKDNNLKNLILITNQSDREVDESLYLKKPQSIKKWFSTNVNYPAEDLVAIPIGINNSYIKNFVHEEDFKTFNFDKFENKKDLFYNNYNLNTRPFHRLDTIWRLSKNKKAVIKQPNQSKNNYLNDLNNYKYIICPWGNGFDSHRIWEAIYSGSLAITKKSIAFESFETLPIISLEKFNKNNLKKINFLSEKANYALADFKYWKDLIYSEKISLESKRYRLDGEKINNKFLSNKKLEDKKTAKFKKRRRFTFKLLKNILKILSKKNLKNIL